MALTEMDSLDEQARKLGASNQDIDLMYSKNESSNENNTNQYRRIGSFLSDTDMQEYCTTLLNEANRLAGRGGFNNTLQTFLCRLDRYGTATPPVNTLCSGYTFITRPRLNLTSPNIKQNSIMSTLISNNPQSISFVIRALLDSCMSTNFTLTKVANSSFQPFTDETTDFCAKAQYNSYLFDAKNPFLVPLCNGLKSISGFPDLTLESETTEGDFFGSDFSYVKGGDMMKRSGELNLSFTDVQGSVILTIFYYWCLYIALQAQGVLMAYPDDIYEQRLNYTVSIYRFVTDPTRKYIRWWAKATGCYPKSVPVGALFNANEHDAILSSAMNFSIPFTYGKIEVNEPGILMDFNTLMERYTHDEIKEPNKFTDFDRTPLSGNPGYNFIGLPYIITPDSINKEKYLRLAWMTNASYINVAGFTTAINLNNKDPKKPINLQLGELPAKQQKVYAIQERNFKELLGYAKNSNNFPSNLKI